MIIGYVGLRGEKYLPAASNAEDIFTTNGSIYTYVLLLLFDWKLLGLLADGNRLYIYP